MCLMARKQQCNALSNSFGLYNACLALTLTGNFADKERSSSYRPRDYQELAAKLDIFQEDTATKQTLIHRSDRETGKINER